MHSVDITMSTTTTPSHPEEKRYWHKVTSHEQVKILRALWFSDAELQDSFIQPEWCNHASALNEKSGCLFLLTVGLVSSIADCGGCHLCKPKITNSNMKDSTLQSQEAAQTTNSKDLRRWIVSTMFLGTHTAKHWWSSSREKHIHRLNSTHAPDEKTAIALTVSCDIEHLEKQYPDLESLNLLSALAVEA